MNDDDSASGTATQSQNEEDSNAESKASQKPATATIGWHNTSEHGISLKQHQQLPSQIRMVCRGASELLHMLDKEIVKRLTDPNTQSLRNTVSCSCCGRNFAKAFSLQAGFIRVFSRSDSFRSEAERKFIIEGDMVAWAIADSDCQPTTALERLEVIQKNFRRLHLSSLQVCSVCLHRPGFHFVDMVGTDCVGRPVIFSSFDPKASMGLNLADLPAYLTHLFYCICHGLRFLPETQHGVCLFFDCVSLEASHFTADTVSSVAEVLKMLPCRVAYVILSRLRYLQRRLLVPLLYLTGMQNRVIFLPNGIDREKMLDRLMSTQMFQEPLAKWLVDHCCAEEG